MSVIKVTEYLVLEPGTGEGITVSETEGVVKIVSANGSVECTTLIQTENFLEIADLISGKSDES